MTGGPGRADDQRGAALAWRQPSRGGSHDLEPTARPTATPSAAREVPPPT
ncbi:hypothetical protein [Streptomyces niveus]